MCVLRDVLVQSVHELPSAAFSGVVTKQSEPRSNVEESGAARRWIRHDDLAFVDGFGQVFPSLGLGNIFLCRFDRVEANRRAPYVHAEPCRWILFVAILRLNSSQARRGISLQHALFVEQCQT